MPFIIDRDSELPLYSTVCSFCQHERGVRRCTAFGKRQIPLPIWLGDNPHLEPFPGDNGVQFTPVDTVAGRAALESFRKKLGWTTL